MTIVINVNLAKLQDARLIHKNQLYLTYKEQRAWALRQETA